MQSVEESDDDFREQRRKQGNNSSDDDHQSKTAKEFTKQFSIRETTPVGCQNEATETAQELFRLAEDSGDGSSTC
jgi:hypothetical protein